MNPSRIIISGGGTGGHIFPAVSIANALRERLPACEILFVGAMGRMEMKRVPEAGYEIVGLPVQGFDRSKLMSNVGVVWNLFRSLCSARKVIKSFNPDIAIGVGGYASGPTLWMAAMAGIPTLIQEQNSYAGVTNKLLARMAHKICVAYDGMQTFFPEEKIVMTGNPIRNDLLIASEKKNEALRYFDLSPNKRTLLVVGGSLGARTINHCLRDGLDRLLKQHNHLQLIWQTGSSFRNEAKEALGAYSDSSVWCDDFIRRMDYAYAAADLVISRAGASSISELCLLGKPVILVPSPNVAEDHQTHNAMALVRKDAALLVRDQEASELLIKTALETLEKPDTLLSLSEHIKALAEERSAERIVDEIISIIDRSKKQE